MTTDMSNFPVTICVMMYTLNYLIAAVAVPPKLADGSCNVSVINNIISSTDVTTA